MVEACDNVMIRGGGKETMRNGRRQQVLDVHDDSHCFLSLPFSEALGTRADHSEKDFEQLDCLSHPFPIAIMLHKSGGDILLNICVLHFFRGEVDEESAAHVGLKIAHLLWIGRSEAVHKQATILEKPSTPNLLRGVSVDQAIVQVIYSLIVIVVDGNCIDGGEECLGHRNRTLLSALVEVKVRVYENLERIHSEFVLSSNLVHKLELYGCGRARAARVAE